MRAAAESPPLTKKLTSTRDKALNMIVHTLSEYHAPNSPVLRYLPEGVQLIPTHPSGNPKFGWVAIQHGKEADHGSLNMLLPSGYNSSYCFNGKPGFFVQTQTRDVYIVGITNELFVVDIRSGGTITYPTGLKIADRKDHLINDGIVVDGKGILFSTKAATWLENTGQQYFVPFENPEMLVVQNQVQCGNGTVVLDSTDSEIRIAYIDSPKKTIVEVVLYPKEISNGQVRHKVERVIADFTGGDALPDGMRAAPGVGAPTHLVAAFFHPGNPKFGVVREIEVNSGKVTAEWRATGAARMTCLDFFKVGTDSMIQILVTSADEGTPSEIARSQPNRGCLFSGSTHYNGPLRAPALVPDSFWQRFVAK